MAASVENMFPPFVAASMIRSAATWAVELGRYTVSRVPQSPQDRAVSEIDWLDELAGPVGRHRTEPFGYPTIKVWRSSAAAFFECP